MRVPGYVLLHARRRRICRMGRRRRFGQWRLWPPTCAGMRKNNTMATRSAKPQNPRSEQFSRKAKSSRTAPATTWRKRIRISKQRRRKSFSSTSARRLTFASSIRLRVHRSRTAPSASLMTRSRTFRLLGTFMLIDRRSPGKALPAATANIAATERSLCLPTLI